MLSGETGKRYSNVSDLVLFRATVGLHHFYLKSFSLFSTDRAGARNCGAQLET